MFLFLKRRANFGFFTLFLLRRPARATSFSLLPPSPSFSCGEAQQWRACPRHRRGYASLAAGQRRRQEVASGGDLFLVLQSSPPRASTPASRMPTPPPPLVSLSLLLRTTPSAETAAARHRHRHLRCPTRSSAGIGGSPSSGPRSHPPPWPSLSRPRPRPLLRSPSSPRLPLRPRRRRPSLLPTGPSP